MDIELMKKVSVLISFKGILKLKNVSTYSVQKVKLNLAEQYKMKPTCEGGFFVFGVIEKIPKKNQS